MFFLNKKNKKLDHVIFISNVDLESRLMIVLCRDVVDTIQPSNVLYKAPINQL